MRGHRDRNYDELLRRLRERLLTMAGRVEHMVACSVRALVERDSELARRTMGDDRLVNQAELSADELCLVILATRQPLAADLRFVTLCMKAVTDIERIGDLAVHICERALDLNREAPVSPSGDLVRMASLVQSMLHDAMDAFVGGDVPLAESVRRRDDEVDDLFSEMHDAWLGAMRADPRAIDRSLHLQSVVKWLERMGDHATNIAEHVIFMVEGRDVRHGLSGRDAAG